MNLNVIFVLVATFVPLIGLIVAIQIDRARRKKLHKPLQTEKLLRPAGYSLSLELEKTVDAIMDNLLAACSVSAFAGASFATLRVLIVAKAPASGFAVCYAVLATFTFISATAAAKAFRGYTKARNLRLGIRGEQAVAEALREVADCGLRSFHDFPAESHWNIDHIVVGTRGVFLLETKAISRFRNAKDAHKVIHNGESLQFPTFTTQKPIAQAQRNAKWLANYLRNKTGEVVDVMPVVVLPSWFVESSTKGAFPVQVMNATFLCGFLRRQDAKIDVSQVRRITTVVEERCRDVEF